MVEKLETRSTPALAAINAFVRGSSVRLCSSNKLAWDGVYLEHHRMFPVERNDSVSTHHLVVLFTSHVARGETSRERFAFPNSLPSVLSSFLLNSSFKRSRIMMIWPVRVSHFLFDD